MPSKAAIGDYSPLSSQLEDVFRTKTVLSTFSGIEGKHALRSANLPIMTADEIHALSAAPKMSPEEQDYINSLPIADRPLVIYRLQVMDNRALMGLVRFLRNSAVNR